MGLGRLKHGLLIQFKRYVDQLTGSSGFIFKASAIFERNQERTLDKIKTILFISFNSTNIHAYVSQLYVLASNA